jgi:hypothetical protein
MDHQTQACWVIALPRGVCFLPAQRTNLLWLLLVLTYPNTGVT